ncbi:unnamed protein product [Medioppia subpectinata]|uniref:Solute carrier organic anion transporter family member n=1 Tax=Medioppia subpectinata TaxID=1979941 RepID=A0A7R9KJ54_9ACAR|nr:unnamed protein product [Medioppia subpectinata]CAG2104452.1 unnamed protein product [Medioppia subpectinata]
MASTGCGIGSWRPKWLQLWATPKMFLLLFGLEGILQGGAYMYMVASLTTLEKRYAFNSLVSGFILIADDVSGLIFRPIMGYLANRLHRPRLIGWSMILVSLGCFFATVPYIIYGPGVHMLGTKIVNKTVEYCDNNRGVDSSCAASDSGRSVWIPVLFLWLSTALNGVGGSAFWTIGMPFIDDSVKKKNSPIYISMAACFRLLGPTIAFLLSAYVLTYYENPLIDPGITDKRDPRYVGAWWIGFALLGVLIFIFALPLFMFPKKFAKKHPDDYADSKDDNKNYVDKQVQIERDAKAKAKADAINKANAELSLGFRLMRLLKNPIFVCFVLGTTLRLFGVLGYMTFKPKYMESQYKQSASSANMLSGIIGIVPSCIGILLGGVFIKYTQPGPKVLTSVITIVELFGTIGFISALFLGCPLTPFAALPQYSSCDCFGGSGVATEGYCPTDCGHKFQTYIAMFSISNFVGTLARTGNAIISFRMVDKYDKSLASGLWGSFYSLFAFIPYPLVYGAVTNTACEVWESKCGKTGNCLVYDSDKFRNRLHGLTLTLYFLGSVFDVIIIFLSSRIKNLYDDEEEGEISDFMD